MVNVSLNKFTRPLQSKKCDQKISVALITQSLIVFNETVALITQSLLAVNETVALIIQSLSLLVINEAVTL